VADVVPAEAGDRDQVWLALAQRCEPFLPSIPRAAEEGTWGWDYRTSRLVCDPFLRWWHGRRYQGGSGAYRTDGPCAPDLPPVYKPHCEPSHDQ
jgi:hypothetical protein